MNTTHSPRLVWMFVGLALMVVVATGAGDRLVSQWAFAAERGRLRANASELARVEEVSNAFRMVSRVAKPAVVHIRAEGGGDEEELAAELDRLRRLHPDLPEGFRFPNAPASSGSGVLIDADGYIVTNHHVVGGRESITVRLHDDRVYEATIVGDDPKTDLAVLKIDAPDLNVLQFGDSDAMEVGDWVLAVGAPFGLTQTVTHGIVSAKGRRDIGGLDREMYQDFIQTDAAINPGNSGGPLLNLRGEIIGINTAIASRGDGNEGVAFTIPSSMVAKVSRQLIEHGEVARGWLGISMTELSTTDIEVFDLPERGVLVTGVVDGDPADRAGIAVEDVVLKINDQPASDMDTVRQLIADIPPGTAIDLAISREGRQRAVRVVLGRQPVRTQGAVTLDGQSIEALGLQVRTLLEREEGRFGLDPGTRGVLVLGTAPDADEPAAGFERFDTIVECNGKPVRSVADLRRVLQSARRKSTLSFTLAGQGGDRTTVTVPRD